MTQDLERNGKFARLPLLLLTALALAVSPAGAQVDLVTNGDFEAGFIPDGTCDLLEPDNDQLPVSWNCYETFFGGAAEPSLLSASALNGPSRSNALCA